MKYSWKVTTQHPLVNTVRLNPFALRYRRAFPGFDTLAYPALSLSKGQPERLGY